LVIVLVAKVDKPARARTENKMLLTRRAAGIIPAADYKNKFTFYARSLRELGQFMAGQ
jgi:hypothetical protein